MALTGRRAWWSILGWSVITIFVLIFVLYYHAKLILNESLYVEKATYPYYVVIPKEIRILPLLKPSNSPVYFYSASDSHKPTIAEVSYQTSDNENNIISFYDNYFTSLGYEKISKPEGGDKLAFKSSVGNFFVNIKYPDMSHDGSEVSIELVN